MIRHPFLSASLTFLCLAAPVDAVPFDDWTYSVEGGSYFLPEGTPQQTVEYPFDWRTNPFLQNRVTYSGEIAEFDSRQSWFSPFCGPDGVDYVFNMTEYTLSLARSFCLGAGDMISGYAKVWTEDFNLFNDCADIHVNGIQAWHWDLTMRPDRHGEYWGDWQPWSFVAPTAGTYTVSLSVFGDDEMDTTVWFRDINVTSATPVPDESPTWLMVVFSCAVMFLMRRGCRASVSSAT